ncbi:MAG: phosphoribosylanthranilate isomerase [Alcanivoracaceae bacterium]|nr:phosphoribosylanthranilate isomerase [Alcanivoracaceae bacterium]
MHRTRIKICGITRTDDMRVAVESGADAIGFVFYPPSPRAVSASQAAEIVSATPAFVTTVGLFVNPSADEVEQVLNTVSLDMLQFHGDETPEFCAAFKRPFIKAIRMRDDVDLQNEATRWSASRGLLVDAYVSGVPGGTGTQFDWRRIPKDLPLPIILAGGLDPENIATAISQTRPWAVDVSGGVEEKNADGKARGGIKSAAAIKNFIQGVESVRAS